MTVAAIRGDASPQTDATNARAAVDGTDAGGHEVGRGVGVVHGQHVDDGGVEPGVRGHPGAAPVRAEVRPVDSAGSV
jgi:hypothetical protein